MSELTIKSIEESEIETVLAEDINFTGTLSFDDSLMIKGKFQGEICAKGDLHIGTNAEVEAKLEASLVSIKGSVKGNVTALSRIELFSSSSLEGDINTPSITMENGSKFNGKCAMK
ncbi:MAG: polymer-forming cytoskeletal protein [Spirochaetales bacterium]|nr:MAG: polymer-forming cytoskeletal protein [Spirochaetales bacterium]